MKKLLIPFLFLAGIISIAACNKENSSDSNPVKADKTDGIKKGEPVKFSVNNLSAQTAQWAVSPSENVQLSSDGNKATILFSKAGYYSVLANMGSTTARIMVAVTDSSYSDSTHIPCDSLRKDSCNGGVKRDSIQRITGDLLRITPSSIDSGSLSGFSVAAITDKSYPCLNNHLMTYIVKTDSGYTFHYTGVQIPWNCTGGQARSQSVRSVFPVQNGNHLLKVVVSGVTYTGSFTKTGSQYSFTWPYTSGVTISPLTIN